MRSMSRICHETRQYVENPYQAMSAYIQDPFHGKPIAFSNLELSLGREAYERVEALLTEEPRGVIGYALETHKGVVGYRGTVQISLPCAIYDNHRFLTLAEAQKLLPRTATDLLKEPEWMEIVGGQFQPARWAPAIYEFFRRITSR